ARLLLERVEVLARGRKQLTRLRPGDPRLDADPVRIGARAAGVEVLAAPPSAHDLQRLAGGTRLVHDARAGPPPLRPALILARPPAVVRHRLAAEHVRIETVAWRDRRVVDQHHDRLAPDVDVLVVVPAILRRNDAVSDEHEVRV